MPCEHLAPIVAYLQAAGKSFGEGEAWGKIVLKLDCASSVDLDQVRKHVGLAPVVEVWEQDHYWFPREQGFVCKEHNHVLAWPLEKDGHS